MSKLTIVAHITAKVDKIEQVKAELEKLIAPTCVEEGCLQYDLHQDRDNPAYFMFYENWQSRTMWQQHLASKHLAHYKTATEGNVDEFRLNEMTHLAD
ncbi:MAG: putative quinol monooxygenase [Terasakiella sp.]|uniref:putative quinol monooxygenase n=1 Tax=unclassified Terasakiella TaxID=2614952 RepID=UPI003AFFB0CE